MSENNMTKAEMAAEIERLKGVLAEVQTKRGNRRTGVEVDGVILSDAIDKAWPMKRCGSRSEENLKKFIPLRLKLLGIENGRYKLSKVGSVPFVQLEDGREFNILVGSGPTDYYLVEREPAQQPETEYVVGPEEDEVEEEELVEA